MPTTGQVRQALTLVPWINKNTQVSTFWVQFRPVQIALIFLFVQFAFYLNLNFWMPSADIFVRPADLGLDVMLIGNDINWKAQAQLTRADQEPGRPIAVVTPKPEPEENEEIEIVSL